MIKIENVDVHGFEAALRGMRNPLESWSKSDGSYNLATDSYEVGSNDLELAKKLALAGPDHGKFMRYITVTCDITAPLYWWKEMDTYKIGTVRNSCSTMHKVHEKLFDIDDFSHEHIEPLYIKTGNKECDGYSFLTALRNVIYELNLARHMYLKTKDKRYWRIMIQLLPSSYNQRATMQFNYAALRNIYHQRKNHKLTEWHDFCDWVEGLPYSELITSVKG